MCLYQFFCLIGCTVGGECSSKYQDFDPGVSDKKKAVSIEAIDAETKESILSLFVVWECIQNPEKNGTVGTFKDRIVPCDRCATFDGPLEDVDQIRVTVSAEGYKDYSFEYRYILNECSRYDGRWLQIALAKTSSSNESRMNYPNCEEEVITAYSCF